MTINKLITVYFKLQKIYVKNLKSTDIIFIKLKKNINFYMMSIVNTFFILLGKILPQLFQNLNIIRLVIA
jgi:hypothetical protein